MGTQSAVSKLHNGFMVDCCCAEGSGGKAPEKVWPFTSGGCKDK